MLNAQTPAPQATGQICRHHVQNETHSSICGAQRKMHAVAEAFQGEGRYVYILIHPAMLTYRLNLKYRDQRRDYSSIEHI